MLQINKIMYCVIGIILFVFAIYMVLICNMLINTSSLN